MQSNPSKTILIVDNDPSVLAALKARLGGMGYGCITASCGAQALGTFATNGADLVISDLNMPQGDGVALAEGIRRVSNVPIILISGCKDDYRKRLRSIQDVSFLHKPFESEEMVRLVEAALGVADKQSVQAQRAA